MKNPFKKDKKIGMENVPDSVEFQFYDNLKKQNELILKEIQYIKKRVGFNRVKYAIAIAILTAIFIGLFVSATNGSWDLIKFIEGLIPK